MEPNGTKVIVLDTKKSRVFAGKEGMIVGATNYGHLLVEMKKSHIVNTFPSSVLKKAQEGIMNTRITIVSPFMYSGDKATIIESLEEGSVLVETDNGEELVLTCDQYQPMVG